MQGMQQELTAVTRSRPHRLCSHDGCERHAKTRGLCLKHWQKKWRTGEVGNDRPLCSRDDCAHFVHARGLCATHYQRERDAEPGPRCCAVDCDRHARVRGYCRKCYSIARRSGEIDRDKMVKCQVPSCTELVRSRLCRQHLRRSNLYSLTVEQLDALDIGTPCDICGRRATDVDHDHSTGEVRGFLCGPCNTSIGLLQDNPALLIRAADYVKRARRTTCPKGHDLKLHGVVTPEGGKVCRQCNREALGEKADG